tara:strand:+ start:3878 stop:4096 length:219 start_codon:yes stop_codon:yes gene_type:complete
MKFTPINEFTGTITAKKNYEGTRCRVVGINDEAEFVVLVATSEGDLYPITAALVRPDIDDEPATCGECGAHV